MLAGLGFTTLFTQVFLIREAGVWLRGNEFVVAAILAAWLMWTATGCIISFYITPDKYSNKWIYPAWIASVFVSIIELILLRCLWACTGKLPGESINLSHAAILSIATTALPCLFSGFATGAAIKSLKDSGKKLVAYIYLPETIGALIAGILITFFFIPLQHWWFSIAFLFSIPLLQYLGRWGQRPSITPFRTLRNPAYAGHAASLQIFLIFLFLLAAYKYNDTLEHFSQKTSSRFLTGKIVLDIDSPRERFTVTTRDNESAFYINGRLTGSSVQRELAEEISWYSFLSAEKPETALLIGFPYNGLLREFLQKNFSEITIPEPEKELINQFSPFLLPEDSKAINSSHVKIVPEDCRTFLQTHKNTSFDIIVQNIGIPESYASSRLYSKEWYIIIAEHLSLNGTFTIVLPGSAGYVPDDLARILSRTIITMESVFKYVTIIPGSSTLLIASNTKQLSNTPDLWLNKPHFPVRQIQAKTRWFNEALINDNLNTFRVAQFTNACAQFKSLPVHKDLSPFLYGDALLYSEARFAGTTHKILSLLYSHGSAVMIFSLIMLILWAGATYASGIANFPKAQIWFLMTTFSAVGFIGEMTLLVRFVIERGNLFYSIGLLFSGFMFGLAIAAYTIERSNILNGQSPFCKGKGRRMLVGRGISIPPFLKWNIPVLHREWVRGILNLKFPLQLLLIAVIILCATLCAITFLPWPVLPSHVMIFSFVLNTISGLCVGTCFTILAHHVQNIKHGGIVLYAADLCGALIGGLLFSIIIPPVLGFGFLTAIVTGLLILILPAVFFRH